jgi:inward rectifier potassium channel
MSSFRKYNPGLKTNNDTGFGSNATYVGGRFINKDGSFNLRREGTSFLRRIGIYQKMLTTPTWKFIMVILIFYVVINVFFTAIYLLIGPDQLQGMISQSGWPRLKEVFYFSTQTYTTLGYGRINPLGDAANIISSLEALTGFLSFAIATGLIYGRFSKPKSYLLFTDNALIGPYGDKTAFMFRIVTYKDNHTLTNVEIKLNAALRVEENGTPTYKFYDLTLERYKVDNLPMNWTVVHPIDENSPLYGFTQEDMVAADAEIYVLIIAFDDVFSSPVLKRTSYTYREMLFGKKFVPMYRESEDGTTTILQMHKLNATENIG